MSAKYVKGYFASSYLIDCKYFITFQSFIYLNVQRFFLLFNVFKVLYMFLKSIKETWINTAICLKREDIFNMKQHEHES